MQLHQNRPIKRAGVAGKALRASGVRNIKNYRLSAS